MSSLLTLNIFHTLSGVSIVSFEQVNVNWVILLKKFVTYRKTSETFEVIRLLAKQIKGERKKLSKT